MRLRSFTPKITIIIHNNTIIILTLDDSVGWVVNVLINHPLELLSKALKAKNVQIL